MIKIKNKEVLDFLTLCEKSQELVNRLDYQYNRYGIKYTMCLIELSDILIEKNFNLKHYLRYTDEIVNVNEKYKFIFFTHTSIDNAYKALLALEKNLINNFFQFKPYDGFLFKTSAVEKTKFTTSSEMIKKLKNFLLLNEHKNEFIFLNENN